MQTPTETEKPRPRRFRKWIKCTECGSRCPLVFTEGPWGHYECPGCCNTFERGAK